MNNYLLILAILAIICLVFELLPNDVNITIIQIITIVILAYSLDDANLITGGNPETTTHKTTTLSVDDLMPDFEKIITNTNNMLTNTNKIQCIYIFAINNKLDIDPNIAGVSFNNILDTCTISDLFSKQVLRYALAMYLYTVSKAGYDDIVNGINSTLTIDKILYIIPTSKLINYLTTAFRRLTSIKGLTLSAAILDYELYNDFYNMIMSNTSDIPKSNGKPDTDEEKYRNELNSMLVYALIKNNQFNPLNDNQINILLKKVHVEDNVEMELLRYASILYAVNNTHVAYSNSKYQKLILNTSINDKQYMLFIENPIKNCLEEAMSNVPLKYGKGPSMCNIL